MSNDRPRPGVPDARPRPRFGRPVRSAALAAIGTAFAWSLLGLSVPWSEAGGDRFEGPLPPCTVGDTLTPRRDPADWALTLLDTEFAVAREDVPPDLVTLSDAGVPGRGEIRAIVVDDLRALDLAARAAGAAFTVTSAYRSFDRQADIFDDLGRAEGRAQALLSVARPGHSEHQLGTTIDVEGGESWLAEHAWEYGFVLSYPAEWSPQRTCYKAEPWHFRYVGRDAARAVRESGLSLREWLWVQQPR